MKDLYEILGVEVDASLKEIRKAYRKKAHELHPDKNTEDTTVEFQELKNAHDVLSDQLKRKIYDENDIHYDKNLNSFFIQALNYHINNLAIQDFSLPSYVNIIDEIVIATNHEIKAIEEQSNALKKKKNNADNLKKRISYKGKENNMFVSKVDDEIANITKQIQNNDKFIIERKAFIEFLKDYNCTTSNGGITLF